MGKDRRDSIFSIFPLANIKDSYLEYQNNMKTYFYKIESYVDTDWLNDYKIKEHINKISLKLSELSEDYVLTLNIVGNQISQVVDKRFEHFKKLNEYNTFMTNYLEDKQESVSKKKKIIYNLYIKILHVL